MSTVKVRDALVAYVELAREDALRLFLHQQTLYAQGALKQEPKLPPILRD